MMSLFQDTHIWVLIAFVCAFFIGFKYGRGSVVAALDNRSNEIRNNIEEAEKLRLEAQDLLSGYQRKYRDAMKEADAIIKEAKLQVAKSREKSLEEIKDRIAQMEDQAKKKLLREQENAILEIRGIIADEAVKTAHDTLKSSIKSADLESLKNSSVMRIAETIR